MRITGFSIIALALLTTNAPRAIADVRSPPRPAGEATARTARIRDSVARGVAFLVNTQNADGSWGTGKETRGFEVYAMVPGSHDAFRVATTALCVMALREAGETQAHDRGLEYLVNHAEARRQDGALIYNTWAHTYAVQALSIEMQHRDDPRLRQAIVGHLKHLGAYETYMGGWNYYDFRAQTETPSMGPTSFGTAAGLVALREAKQAGIDVPQAMIDRAIKRLTEMRLPDGSYVYSYDLRLRPRLPANRSRGSIGRNQSANYALWLWGAAGIDETAARKGLDVFFSEHAYIEMGRKRQFPHESWYQTAPYYYYFGHYYTARLLEKLGDRAAASSYAAKLADDCILPWQEPDGSWWDFAMWDYHKPYGTAFAVMTLLRCE